MSSADDTKSPQDEAPGAADHGHGPPPGEEPRWLDDPANVKKIIRVFWASCVVLLIPDLLEGVGLVHFKHAPHESFWWTHWVGFYAAYGFVACVVLVLIAKQMRKVIMRDEDYYDE